METESIYRIYNAPTLVIILSQINPVSVISSYFSNIHYNIILPPVSRSS
jgi:hypothetical protein